MFTIDGKEYEIEYSQKRIELIENTLKRSVMDIVSNSSAMMTLRELKTFVAYALKQTGATAFVNPTLGTQIAEKLLEENGYSTLLGTVIEAIERDCGFFFRTV